jgi:hypothetical protein
VVLGQVRSGHYCEVQHAGSDIAMLADRQPVRARVRDFARNSQTLLAEVSQLSTRRKL